MAEKERAGRNRTLSISDNEIPELERNILHVDDIRRSFQDDSIVNADLYDCLDYIPDSYYNLIIIDLIIWTRISMVTSSHPCQRTHTKIILGAGSIKYVINCLLPGHCICVVIGNAHLLCKE